MLLSLVAEQVPGFRPITPVADGDCPRARNPAVSQRRYGVKRSQEATLSDALGEQPADPTPTHSGSAISGESVRRPSGRGPAGDWTSLDHSSPKRWA